MRRHRRPAVLAVVAACAAVAGTTPPATAATYELSGTQVAVDEADGLFLNYGGLLGVWKVDTFTPDPVASPLFHATGTETFYGCLNLNRDGYCYKEPTGTLSFTYDFWARFASADPASEVWGGCFHPIVAGTGDLAGADGVVTMIDTPTPRGVHTRWQGTLVLPDAARAQASRRRHRLRARQILRRSSVRHAAGVAAPGRSCGTGT